ncbi:MAG: hypothetical protein PHO79_09125, partial [Desulfoplanes sp.]|nr:hypothetical protein [Desulfoplanes sp.]
MAMHNAFIPRVFGGVKALRLLNCSCFFCMCRVEIRFSSCMHVMLPGLVHAIDCSKSRSFCMRFIDSVDIQGKRLLIRVDYNVP